MGGESGLKKGRGWQVNPVHERDVRSKKYNNVNRGMKLGIEDERAPQSGGITPLPYAGSISPCPADGAQCLVAGPGWPP